MIVKQRPVGTRSFLVIWYLQWVGIASMNSWFLNHSTLRFMEGTWVFHTFVWAATVGILLLGNHMATGSLFLRGLRDWP